MAAGAASIPFLASAKKSAALVVDPSVRPREALLPVKHLINGTSVAQGAPSDMSAIEYYHIRS
jgi:hypothetical protein